MLYTLYLAYVYTFLLYALFLLPEELLILSEHVCLSPPPMQLTISGAVLATTAPISVLP